jgi:hypothetical protein
LEAAVVVGLVLWVVMATNLPLIMEEMEEMDYNLILQVIINIMLVVEADTQTQGGRVFSKRLED